MKHAVHRYFENSEWGTWNRRHINALMQRKTLREVRISVKDTQTGVCYDAFSWSGTSGNPSIDYYTQCGVWYTGPHTIAGDYGLIGLYAMDMRFSLEFACEDARFAYKVTAHTLNRRYCFQVALLAASQLKTPRPATIRVADNTATFVDAFGEYAITCQGACCQQHDAGWCFLPDAPVWIMGGGVADAIQADSMLARGRARAEALVPSGDGLLDRETAESLVRAPAWNKVYDHQSDVFQCDVTRLWAPDSSYYMFYWDNFFTALLVGLESWEGAYEQVDSVCAEFHEGYLPQCAFEWGASSMINPPIGSFCLLKLYRQYGDREPLARYFPALRQTNDYLLMHKSMDGDGLIQLHGPQEEAVSIQMQGAQDTVTTSALATGLDNSPLYDDAATNNYHDVGMSAIFALDCRCLAMIAEILGDDEVAKTMKARHNRASDAINNTLWDDVNGLYCNTRLDGQHTSIYTPTSFYPMLAGVSDDARTARMVREHLLNEAEFWGEYVIPSVSKMEPAFAEQDYWRGCAWAPMNLLVYEGLCACGQHAAAHALAEKSLRMYRENWVNFGYVPENYSTLTGSITPNCVPFYTWGALMGYIGVEMLFHTDMHGVSLGSLYPADMRVRNIPIGDARFAIDGRKGLTITREGRPFVKADTPVRLDFGDITTWSFALHALGSGTLTCFGEGVLSLRHAGDTHQIPFENGVAIYNY